jgi:hypothetical protein
MPDRPVPDRGIDDDEGAKDDGRDPQDNDK